METLKNFLLCKVNALLGAVLVLLGCNSCSGDGTDEGEADLYGCPYANYRVEGAVLDEEGKPLKDMRVVSKWFDDDYLCKTDTVYTQADGSFKVEEQTYERDSLRIVVEDLKGVYAPDSTKVELLLTEQRKGWCIGTFVGEAHFKLKKK